jgi:tetratricopeptide (TPR) repeat protein
MLLTKDRCYRCRSERAVRKCPLNRDRLIGWECCLELRMGLNCPSGCPYAAQADDKHVSPFPAFRSDSNTEYVQTLKRFIDLWCFKPLPELDNSSPSSLAQSDKAKLLAWLSGFQYPANFPVGYLMQKLGLPQDELEEPQTPESVAFAFFDAVIAQDWDKLRQLTVNDLDEPGLAEMYGQIVSGIPLLKKVRAYSILHAGAADDGVSAMVVLELNHKHLWSVLLSSVSGQWKVRQNINGGPSYYYDQNKLFHAIADALAQGNGEAAWQLLQANLPVFPDSADLYYYRGLYWQWTKQADKAGEDLLKALALDNHFFAAGFSLSAIYLSNGKLDAARQLLRILAAERPDDLNVLNNLAACEAGLGNVPAAVALWKDILKQAPTYEPARKNLERYPE